MFRAITVIGLVALLLFGLTGCGDDSTNGGNDVFNRIVLEPTRFPTLKKGLIYEGWVVRADEDTNWIEYQSFGKFFWDEFDYRFISPTDTLKFIENVFPIEGNVYDYNYIAITLETAPIDNDPAPSPTVVAFSVLDPDKATKLTFPLDLGAAEGYYTIGTFSDGHYKEVGDTILTERFGLWFIQISYQGTPNDTIETYEDGLLLPTLPDTGYVYEGWAALNTGDTVSTGKFFLPNHYDYDNSHCMRGSIPSFPGEDFLVNRIPRIPESRWPVNFLVGGTVFVTIEPNPDNDLDRPTNMIVLRQGLPTGEGALRRRSHQMANVGALQFPQINVTFRHAD